jgi:hypothetical protein
MEEWKSIGYYEISNLGNIRRPFLNGSYKTIKGCVKPNGYRYIRTYENGKAKNSYIHQLVIKNFVGARPTGLVVDHINRNRLDNRLENLRYATYKENTLNSERFLNPVLNKN